VVEDRIGEQRDFACLCTFIGGLMRAEQNQERGTDGAKKSWRGRQMSHHPLWFISFCHRVSRSRDW
jgi:hypothetical protein